MFRQIAVGLLLIYTLGYADGVKDFKKRDYQTAIKLLEKACNGGEADSCTILGILYETSKSVKQDKQTALSYYAKACEMKSDDGCQNYDRYSFVIEEKKNLSANTIESMDLLKMFALDKSVDYTMYDWVTGSEETSIIEWLHEGVKEASQGNKYIFERKGQVIVLNNGRVTHKILKKKLVNGKWTITLRGARGGYFEVDIDSQTVTTPEPMLVIDKKYIIEEKHCEESASSNTSMYLIGFEGKKPFWLKENFSSGSAGGSYWYTIQYDKKPVCGEIY